MRKRKAKTSCENKLRKQENEMRNAQRRRSSHFCFPVSAVRFRSSFPQFVFAVCFRSLFSQFVFAVCFRSSFSQFVFAVRFRSSFSQSVFAVRFRISFSPFPHFPYNRPAYDRTIASSLPVRTFSAGPGGEGPSHERRGRPLDAEGARHPCCPS